MAPIKAVIFDAYGTLISTGTGSLDAAKEILRRNGREDISPEKFYARWKALHREHIDGLSGFLKEAEIFRRDLLCLYQEYGLPGNADEDAAIMLNTLGKRRAFPETRAVLEALSKRFLLAIGSTTDTAPLLADLDRNGLRVPHIYTSESLEVYKPCPAFYRKILDGLGAAPGGALFVGDSLIDDVAGPKRVGMKACWVNRKQEKAVPGVSPDFEIAELTELMIALGLEGETC